MALPPCGRRRSGLSPLGADIPGHVNRYFPAYRVQAPPTPVAVLEQVWAIGKSAGLGFVYLGNVPGRAHACTVCPDCGMLLVERLGISRVRSRLQDGQCPACGLAIPRVWSGV